MHLHYIFNHIGAMLLALAIPGAEVVVASTTQTGTPSKLDPISAGCVTCHDGTSGPHVGFCLLDQKGKGCGGHIVSASYVDLAAGSEKLREVSSLPPQLHLFEGKITCATCHGSEPHDGMPLAINNIDSGLCRACHLK
jgi:hypothetical protein